MSDQIKYYFKEDTNQILVSGSSTKDGMNILLNSTKNPSPIFDDFTTTKISSLGANVSYVIENSGQIGGDTTIPIGNSQELWIYRGWQTLGTGDANAYRYNPHLHRPYKAYILTETGSGAIALPWSPTGKAPFSDFPIDDGGSELSIPDVYNAEYLSSNGNTANREGINYKAIVQGEFTIFSENRRVHPYIYTRYSTNVGGEGSFYYIYKENSNFSFPGTYLTSPTFTADTFSTAISVTSGATLTVQMGLNSVNQTVIQNLLINFQQLKPLGKLRIEGGGNTYNATINNISNRFPFLGYYNFTITYIDGTLPSNSDNSIISFIDFPELQGFPIFQEQGGSENLEIYSPPFLLDNGNYTYTSSVFDGERARRLFGSTSGTNRIGFTQFGLYCDYDTSVEYKAINTSNDTIKISYSSSGDVTGVNVGDPVFIDLKGVDGTALNGYHVKYNAITGTPSFTSDSVISSETFENNIFSTTIANIPTPTDNFTTRVNDVYIAYSSSLSQSIDGLYVFNQIPQSDVQVTVSMFLDAWRGASEGATYGISGGINTNTTYSLDPLPPFYGEGETGDGPTWTTASIRIYTGSYPNAVPTIDNDFLAETIFENDSIHISGLAITASYLIPKAGLTLKKCLSVALQVSTGSGTPASDVENSLVVREYKLEFNTPLDGGTGDGKVPVNLEDAFEGVGSFSNATDCQPLYNVIVTDGNLRRNPLIQEVEYNVPESFLLRQDEPLFPFIYPFTIGSLLTFPATQIFSQSNGDITTSGNGTGISLGITITNGGYSMGILVSNPGSGYRDGDTLNISASKLLPFFGNNISKDLLINLNFVYGLYNPSNFISILANTAIKSSVPESNYTQLSSIIPRYLGAKSSADFVNSVEGLSGGFGTLPVIDYKTAFFAYCDQVLDPYPTINGKTLFNLKYLINEGGDPKQPNLSPYTAFDVEGSWEEGGQGRVGINQISGSNQYDALNNLQPMSLVAKQIVPYFWSQTGNDSYSNTIPMSGKYFNDTSNQFLQYGMTVAGNLYNAGNSDNRIPTLGDNFFQSSQGGGETGKTAFTNLNFTTAFEYGKVNIGGGILNQASASFVGGEVSTGIPPGTPTPTTSTYAEVGEIFFNPDYFAINSLNNLSGNRLSDSYSIRTKFVLPSSPPRSSNFGGESDIGTIQIRLQYLDQGPSDNPTPWPTAIRETNSSRILIDGDVILKLYSNFTSNSTGTISTENNEVTEINLSNIFNEDEIQIVFQGSISLSLKGQFIFTVIINAKKIEEALGNLVANANYATYEFVLKSNEALISQRRYRWNVYQELRGRDTSGAITNRFRNYWNPLTVTRGQENSDLILTPAIEGPFISSTISGNKISIGDSTNEIPLPAAIAPQTVGQYWDFYNDGSTTHYNILEFQPPLGNEIYDKNLNGDIYFMGTLPYTASANVLFPGGQEPSDTSFPELGIPFEFRINDTVRFLNSEDDGGSSGTQTLFRILGVVTPSQTAGNGKLRIELDSNVDESIDKNFFLFRRVVPSPNTIYVDTPFPYGTLPKTKRFVDSTNQSFGDTPAFTGASYPTQATSEGSGSFIEYTEPLRKSDNTPSGILFPEFPTALIDLTPDEILSKLRDNRLIE